MRAMKTIRVLGGMSAASTALSLAHVHARVAEHLVRSVAVAPIAARQAKGGWEEMGARLLEAGVARVLRLATNTMLKVFDAMRSGFGIPAIGITEPTATAIAVAGHRRPTLMATAFTQEERFHRDQPTAPGLSAILPEAEDRAAIHRIIDAEPRKGITIEPSRATFKAIALPPPEKAALPDRPKAWPAVGLRAIAPDHRSQRIGARLLHKSAAIAKVAARGLWLDIFRIQAPRFYRRQGDTALRRMDDCSARSARHFSAKRFDSAPITRTISGRERRDG